MYIFFLIFFLTCFNNSSTINGWFAYAAALRGNSLHLSSLYLNTGRRKYGLVTLAEYSGGGQLLFFKKREKMEGDVMCLR